MDTDALHVDVAILVLPELLLIVRETLDLLVGDVVDEVEDSLLALADHLEDA
jgi:hypothetical protein